MSWLRDNWSLILDCIGAASVLAWVVVKATPNKKDDSVMAKVQRVLDVFALNGARKAGDRAVKDDPAEGIEGVTGKPREVK